MALQHPALLMVLHAHLPFVRHPEHPLFLEENWLFEAMTECYLPLIDALRRLSEREIPTPIAINLSPTLCEMLDDALLRQRYRARLSSLRELSEKEIERTKRHRLHSDAAVFYYHRLYAMQRLYEDILDGDVLEGFRQLRASGLEILASAATHPVLPLISQPTCQRAQIRVGVESYRKRFGESPKGFWLPECAYTPGLESLLAEEGIEYFLLDAHGVLFATPRPHAGIFAPLQTPGGVACFARDAESTRQVWSAEEGYPGDPVYREYYRDLGHDATEEYIRPYLLTEDTRHNVGFKYHRVTGAVDLSEKEPYVPEAAFRRARAHAETFLQARTEQAARLTDLLDHPPVFTAPYDAELFGHWWFEGVTFIEEILRLSATGTCGIQCMTPSSALAEFPNQQVIQPSASSWGYKGYFETWLSGVNDWIYPDLHSAEATLCELAAQSYPAALEPALDQLARELLLAQASDWPFILMTGTMPEYARQRIERHLNRFEEIAEMLRTDTIEPTTLRTMQEQDNIFSWVRLIEHFATP